MKNNLVAQGFPFEMQKMSRTCDGFYTAVVMTVWVSHFFSPAISEDTVWGLKIART